MARRSRVKQLDERVREVVDRLVREERATIDEIVGHLETLLGEAAPSRSSVGRYVKSAREQMARWREARELAKVWIGRLEEDPDSDVGRLLSEMLRTVAFQQLASMGEAEDPKPKDVAMLAGALRDVAQADRTLADRELKVRQETAKAAADRAATVARKGGMSSETVQDLRREILGVAKQ